MKTTKKTMLTTVLFMFSLLLTLPAQAGGPPVAGGDNTPVATGKPAARGKLSAAAKAAIAAAKDLAARITGLEGGERAAAIEAAANAYDKITTDFAVEPAAAAQAAFAAGELWQRQGSLPLAERDFLLAAQLDPQRFGQRGLLEAAEAQRRQKQFDKALATFAQAAAADPASARAHEARLAIGRVQQQSGQIEAAITAFQAALEAVEKPRQVIETCDLLAKAWLQKGDLGAAERAITHADEAVANVVEPDPVVRERLQKALAGMSARKALQKARDKAAGTAKDARAVEAATGGGR
ncbi:MAG: hypothetical protein IPK26_09920 [Planctomycetes bacterium]|nr:hypothetical protein [Planctomycetota bacterium]